MLRRLLRLGLLGAGAAAAARAIKARQTTGPQTYEQPLSAEPDQLPNEPDRPAGTTPAPTGRSTPDGAA